MHRKTAIIAALGLSIVAGSAFALDIGAAIKARQDFFHGVGGDMKGMNDAVKASKPADVARFAADLDSQAPKLLSYFPAGTGMDSGIKTGAKVEIWQQSALFQKDAKDFAAAAHNVNVAAQSGDNAAVQVALGSLGATCKACHQTFRQMDHQ